MTAALGDVRLADLSPEAICAWRLTVLEEHRFEATQALREVLNRAVAWKLIEENPSTGLRPSELFALEHGDVDRESGAVRSGGRTRTDGSTRRRRG